MLRYQKETFYNISNHPSERWSRAQLEAVKEFGEFGAPEVFDIQFPNVPPHASKEELREIADKIFDTYYFDINDTVMVQGEFTLTFELVTRLKAEGICCVAACSERVAIENPDGTKTVAFEFAQFREY